MDTRSTREICAERIRDAETYMYKHGISSDSTYAIILSHARFEWKQGNYMQALKDLGCIPR